jgi:hypothetical protein
MARARRPGALFFVRRSFRLIGGSLLLTAGVALAWTGGNEIAMEQRYREQARSIRAAVVDKGLQPATASASTRYEVTYLVAIPDTVPFHRTEAIDVTAWERLERGSEVELQYLPDQPGSIRLARDDGIAAVAVLFGVGALLASIGAVLTTLGVRDVRRKVHLLHHGTPADATVVGHEETNVRINRRTQWRVTYTYRDLTGREQHGQSGYLSAVEAHEWQPGDTARVHFDRERPELVLWLGDPSDSP